MSGNYYDPGYGDHVVVDGNIVERDTLHIAERIKEYDENLEIMCLDPAMGGDFNDAPFVICERMPNGTLVRIFEAWELDERVIERIAQSDQQIFNPFAKFDALNNASKNREKARYRDKQDEINDIVESAVKNRTSTFKIRNSEGDLVKIHDDRPVEKGGRSYSIPQRTT